MNIAFDLDGCLIESRFAIIPSMRVAFAQLGMETPPDEELHGLIGPPLESGVADLLRRRGEDPRRAADLVLAYRADYRQHMLDRTPLMPGMAGVVEKLAAERTVCVVTSKPAVLSREILRHLGLLDVLAFVEGPNLSMEHETKTETLRRALARIPLSFMVGDRHHDIDAGRAHGLTTVGVLWGMGDAAELAAADHVVATPEELLAVLT